MTENFALPSYIDNQKYRVNLKLKCVKLELFHNITVFTAAFVNKIMQTPNISTVMHLRKYNDNTYKQTGNALVQYEYCTCFAMYFWL